MSDEADILRAHLCDPAALCTALGLLARRGTFARQARGVTVLCPWHDEHSPSCSVTVGSHGTVRAACFGCHASGDALGLIAAVYHLDVRRDFREVMALAAQIAGLDLERLGTHAPPPPPRALPPEPERLDDETFAVIAAVIARRCPVDAAPDVAAYLDARGLYDAAAGECAALPGDAAGVAALLDAITADVGEDAWRRSGLAWPESGALAWPQHRLVLFWRDADGAVATLQRRALVAMPAARKYVFPRGRAPRWPFGIERAGALGPAGEVAFCEGALDALALRHLSARAGYDRLVLGLPGVGGWKQPWAKLATGRVAVVATDDDEAGEACAATLAADLFAAGAVDVKRATPDGAHDWAEALERAVREVAA